ncbi:hypothetical protein PENTCL1PPCAC_16384, partial [Pristionchus entomophagus]
TAFYCACFTIPFALMNIHFLFRYWAVKEPHLIELFSRPSFIFLLFTISFTGVVVWFIISFRGCGGVEDSIVGAELLRAAYEREYGKRIENGWLVMDYWDGQQSTRYVTVLILFDILMIVSFSLALSFGALTYHGLRDAKQISIQARALQLKLLAAVTAQTLIPLFSVYIPYAVVINFPYFDLPSGPMGDMCMLLTACFPAWDAVIIITLMTDYREALWTMTVSRCRKTSSTIRDASSGMMTTAISS